MVVKEIDMLQCDNCNEIFKIPTETEDCPYCGSLDFHRINYDLEELQLRSTSVENLPFQSICASQRLKTDKVIDGIYYVLCSTTYNSGRINDKKYVTKYDGNIRFVELDKATIYTNTSTPSRLYSFNSTVRELYCEIHRVLVLNKHIVQDLDTINFN